MPKTVNWLDQSHGKVDWKLLHACTFRHRSLAREALAQGANVNCRRSDFLTPLHIVVKHNDVDLIQLLCDQPSVDIESKTMYGLTSLHVAASLGHNEALRKLLENGAMVNCRDRFKRCPLHYVALRNDTKNASVLLKYNANANVHDIFHENPVSSSVRGTPHLPMIQLLLKHGATVESSAEHYTLGLLLETVLSTRLLSDMSVLDLLFQKADVNTTDFIGLRTPMHIAAMTGNFLLAVYLIEKGADPNRKNRAGLTPIDVALKLKNFQIADLLTRHHARHGWSWSTCLQCFIDKYPKCLACNCPRTREASVTQKCNIIWVEYIGVRPGDHH